MKIGCGGCTATWAAGSWAHCSGCHATFTAVLHFDHHRSPGPGCWVGWTDGAPLPTEGAPPPDKTPPPSRRIPPPHKGVALGAERTLVWDAERQVWSTDLGHEALTASRERMVKVREARGQSS